LFKTNNDISIAMNDHLINKAKGCFLGVLIGDALGAPVEGFPPELIVELVKSLNGGDKNEMFLKHYIPAIQMGTVTPLRTEIGYRWATEASDENFVSPGPTSNPALAPFLREGYFSDDGNSCIALTESLVECQKLEGAHVALSYAKAWKSTPTRGYPPTAKV
jgi:ADP-ribosylglycohydrolase